MAFAIGIVLLVILSGTVGFMFGVLICTETDTNPDNIDLPSQRNIDQDSQNKNVSRETSNERKNKHE